MRVRWLALVLVAPALAGCLSAAPPGPDAAYGMLAAARITTEPGAVAGNEPLFWKGKTLTFADDPDAACVPEHCDRFRFALELPDGFWETHDGALEVSIHWPVLPTWNHRESGFFALALHDAEGNLLAQGEGALAQVILFEDAPSGTYEATVRASGGDEAWNEGWVPAVQASTYRGVVQVEATPNPAQPPAARDLLPDLVTMRPIGLRIEDRSAWADDEVEKVSRAALSIKGCKAYEATEAQARRCLRFQNAVGNAGEGPFEVRLDGQQAAASVAGAGRFVQRIHRSDGSFHDEPAGVAEYHPTHEHIHYQDLTRFTVFQYDPVTAKRGAAVGEGRKVGFCAGELGLVELGRLGTTLPGYGGRGCLNDGLPVAGTEWSMGQRPGWYDPYSASRDDQYVEMSGVPDGVYELVSVVDPGGTLRESDPSNNEASVVFRLTGDEVEVLASTGPPLGPEAA